MYDYVTPGVLLALLRAGTPKWPGAQPQQDPWEKNQDNVLERIQLWFSYLSPTVTFPEPRQLSQHVSNPIKWGKNTISVVPSDCVQLREFVSFSDRRRKRDGEITKGACVWKNMLWCMWGKCEICIGGYTFKTGSIGRPNQRKKRKQAPVIHKVQSYD